MKKSFLKIAGKAYELVLSLFTVPAARYVVWAFSTVTFAEVLNVGFFRGMTYMLRHPLSFAAAALIVYFSYTLTLLTSRRIGLFILLEALWIGMAVANCILLSYRVNPLSAVDFSIIFSVFGIINIYLSPWQIILIAVAVLSAIALGVFMMIKLPKERQDYKSASIFISSTAVLAVTVFIASTFVFSGNIDSMNLPSVYGEYGFIYSFSLSCVDRGIERPDEYSRVNISNMLSENDDTDKGEIPETEKNEDSSADGELPDPSAAETPNVIFVQLESFFDPREIKGLEISENPIPNFTAIRETYPSGTLTVPVAGAGTVNTEFEVLCGIPLSVFGLGEYPYETYLSDNPCESIAYYMRNSGYTTHSFHNHTGTFYDRYKVMKNLGFDTFTPVEYMSDVERNILGWAHDDVLTDQIVGAMNSTEGRDFMYVITVQAHGKYVSAPGDYGDIKVSGDFDEASLFAMEYYVNQIYETDRFIGDLLAKMSHEQEETVIVFFGDHQPSIELTDDDIRSGSVYNTEYVIWSNFKTDEEDEDLYSYELSARVLEILDIEGGVITKIHHASGEKQEKKDKLGDIAYDIFFGEKYAYGGTFPYDVPDMRYGWRDIKAESVFIKNGVLYVFGEGFTEASVINIDGRKKDTIYVSDELIVTGGVDLADKVTVSQISESGFIFGEVTSEVTDSDKIDFEIVKEGENGDQTE